MAKGEKRPFAVFDIDGTLIRWQLYHAVADSIVKLGFTPPDTFDSIRVARMRWKQRVPNASFRQYELELIRIYEEVLENLTGDQLEQAAQTVFKEYKEQTYIYTRDLIGRLKKDGYTLLAISGSQIEIVKLVAEHYGFDDCVGTVYERSGNIFNGQKTVPSHDKAKVLKDLVKKHGLSFEKSLAIGDSLSDAAMLELVEQPIAFNPDKDLFERAKEEGWKVVIERKNMVYELESRDGKYQLAKTNAG